MYICFDLKKSYILPALQTIIATFKQINLLFHILFKLVYLLEDHLKSLMSVAFLLNVTMKYIFQSNLVLQNIEVFVLKVK